MGDTETSGGTAEHVTAVLRRRPGLVVAGWYLLAAAGWAGFVLTRSTAVPDCDSRAVLCWSDLVTWAVATVYAAPPVLAIGLLISLLSLYRPPWTQRSPGIATFCALAGLVIGVSIVVGAFAVLTT